MGKCVFQTKDVRRCIVHALEAGNWEMGLETGMSPPQPGLFFVHDQGVYLMSNGNPSDVLPGSISNYVAFAEHCDPAKNDDWWEHSRLLVGGDDFGELIPITAEFLTDCDAFRELVIDVDPTELSVTFRNKIADTLGTHVAN